MTRRHLTAALALAAALVGCTPEAPIALRTPTPSVTDTPTTTPTPAPDVRRGQVRLPVVRVGDARLPDHTVLRPRDTTPFLLPVLLWGNGGCRTTNQEHTRFLNDLA